MFSIESGGVKPQEGCKILLYAVAATAVGHTPLSNRPPLLPFLRVITELVAIEVNMRTILITDHGARLSHMNLLGRQRSIGIEPYYES